MKKQGSTEEAMKAIQLNLDNRRRAIFTKNDLKEIVIQNLPDVGLNQRTLIQGQILKYLWEKEKLKEVKFEFPSRKETRYLFGDITNLELAQSLKPNAYLAHRAAMFIHGLCDEYPAMIYINVEQSQNHKRNTNTLTQSTIDQAFKNKARVSNEIAEANNMKVCITHGQKTDQLGVEARKGPSGELLRVTDIERTLIDITVRPVYAGGPREVIRAYGKAAEIVSIDKLNKMLIEMNFVYPYYQSVGFYLQASKAFSNKDIKTFENIDKKFDFYLDYRMKKPAYSQRWKIYYPESLVERAPS